MKKTITILTFCLFTFSTLFAQNDVVFSATDNWTAFMNVTDLPADGGAYQFGSPWEVAALKIQLMNFG